MLGSCGTEAGEEAVMQRCDVSGAWTNDQPRGVGQGAWGDGDRPSSAPRSSRLPVYQQLVSKPEVGGHEPRNRDVMKLSQNGDGAGDGVMQLESFDDTCDDDDNNDNVQPQCQDKSPVSTIVQNHDDVVSSPASVGDDPTKPSPLQSSGGWCEEEVAKEKVTPTHRRRSIFKRASGLWRSTSKNDVWEFKQEVSVDNDDASTKKTFGLFKKAAVKLAAVKQFEDGAKKGRGKEGGKCLTPGNNVGDSDTDTNVVIPDTPKKKTFGLFKKATLKVQAVKRFEGSEEKEGKGKKGAGRRHSIATSDIRESDADISVVIPSTPKKKTFGLFKKATLKVQAVNRFEEPMRGNEKKGGDPDSGKREQTCGNGREGVDCETSGVPSKSRTKKSFGLFKKAALKVTAVKRFEGIANGNKGEGMIEGNVDEMEEGCCKDVSPFKEAVLSHDVGLLDFDDEMDGEDCMVEALSSSGMEGVSESLPVVTRTTAMTAWGNGSDADSDKNVSFSSYNGCALNNTNSNGPACSPNKTGISSTEEEKPKGKLASKKQARGNFRKAFTFLKAMNGFGGGLKSNTSSAAEKGKKMEEVKTDDVMTSVVSPTMSVAQEIVSTEIQDWDSDTGDEDVDVVQSVGVNDDCVTSVNMCVSKLDLSSDDDAGSGSGIDEVPPDCAQSPRDIASSVSEGSSIVNARAAIDNAEETTKGDEVAKTDAVMSDNPLVKPKAGKRKLKKAFLTATFAGLFKKKSGSSKTVNLPENVVVVDSDQQVGLVVKASRCDLDGESVKSWSGYSTAESDVIGTKMKTGNETKEKQNGLSGVDAASVPNISQQTRRNSSTCRIPVTPDHDRDDLSGHNISNRQSSTPVSPLKDVRVDKSMTSESTVTKKWKLFSQNKKKSKKRCGDVKLDTTDQNVAVNVRDHINDALPEDIVVKSDQQVGLVVLSSQCDLDGESVKSWSGCSFGEPGVTVTKKKTDHKLKETQNGLGSADTASVPDVSQQSRRNSSTCHIPVTPDHDHDDKSGSDISSQQSSTPVSPLEDVRVDKSTTSESTVTKKWKLFSQNKKKSKKRHGDVSVKSNTTAQNLAVDAGRCVPDAMANRHVLPHGGQCQHTSMLPTVVCHDCGR